MRACSPSIASNAEGSEDGAESDRSVRRIAVSKLVQFDAEVAVAVTGRDMIFNFC